MTKLWSLRCDANSAVFTYRGRAIVHTDKRELEYLFPGNEVVELPSYWEDTMTISLKDHPDMDTVRFPLDQNMDQFRVPRKK